uniref:Serine/arginine-rich splicing factor 7 n=2 Tax=Laurasiatheria TaxID=314145 RepID=A0A452UC68_URSMA
SRDICLASVRQLIRLVLWDVPLLQSCRSCRSQKGKAQDWDEFHLADRSLVRGASTTRNAPAAPPHPLTTPAVEERKRLASATDFGSETKVYVGNLGTGAGKGELERAFSYYGPLRTVWIARNPPGFAFVEFEDPRDAEDAVRGLDGKVICGSRVRVELSTGMPRRSRFDRPPARRPFDPNDRCYECGEKGHYAYDCHRYSRRRRSRSRSRSHSRSRGRRYSRSRSRSRGRRSRSASPRRSRSVSLRRSRSASLRRSRSGSIKGSRYFQSRSRSRSRSRSLSRPRSSRSKSRSPSPKRSRSPSGSPRRSASPERVD